MSQTRIYLFVSLFIQKIRRAVLVYYKLELGICLIIADIFLNFSPAFQNTRSSFREVFHRSHCSASTVMEYRCSAPVIRSRKALHANLLKIKLYQRYFDQVQNSDIEKCISLAASEDNYFLRTFLNGCLVSVSVKSVSTQNKR